MVMSAEILGRRLLATLYTPYPVEQLSLMRGPYLSFGSLGLANVPDSRSTVMWMVYPLPRCWLTPYRASPSRMSEIHWPDGPPRCRHSPDGRGRPPAAPRTRSRARSVRRCTGCQDRI